MVTILDIVKFLGPEADFEALDEGAASVAIVRPQSLDVAEKGHVGFCGSTAKNPQALLAAAKASLILVDRTIPVDAQILRNAGVSGLIRVDSARGDFARLVGQFFSPPRLTGIHPSAVIDPSASLGDDVYVGPLSSVGKNVTIGAGTTIHAGVHIYDGVTIGRNVAIHSGCIIGGDGFGYERLADGSARKVPHVGSVVIEDDVELCGQCHVARGTLKDTIVRRGVKIDGICHIAHNVELGEHTLVAANAMFSGGVVVGARSWIGPSTSVIDRVSLGEDVFTGVAAVVTKNLPAGSRVMGAPARPVDEYKQWLKASKALVETGVEKKRST